MKLLNSDIGEFKFKDIKEEVSNIDVNSLYKNPVKQSNIA